MISNLIDQGRNKIAMRTNDEEVRLPQDLYERKGKVSSPLTNCNIISMQRNEKKKTIMNLEYVISLFPTKLT